MISVAQALAQVLDLAAPLPAETVPLRAARGRVLAAPATAGLTQPPFDAAAMDGYWLTSADARPGAALRLVGEAAAGKGYRGTLTPGAAVRIFTGAPCPAPGGVVVVQEDVTVTDGMVTLPAALSRNSHIRPRGQDFREGETYFPRRPLTPRDLGLLAAMNCASLSVHRRPVVAVLATGDELVEPGTAPGPDQIISSNSVLLAAMAESWGAKVRLLPIARDTTASLRATFALAEGADLLLSSGGASVGDHDLVAQVAADLGLERAFWKVAMRPGKPLMAGRMGASALLGLPGNPVAAAVCAELFLRPILMRFQGLEGRSQVSHATLGCDLPAEGGRDHYLRASLATRDGRKVITPFAAQDSALLSGLATADALLIRPAQDGPRRAGERVEYLPL